MGFIQPFFALDTNLAASTSHYFANVGFATMAPVVIQLVACCNGHANPCHAQTKSSQANTCLWTSFLSVKQRQRDRGITSQSLPCVLRLTFPSNDGNFLPSPSRSHPSSPLQRPGPPCWDPNNRAAPGPVKSHDAGAQ